MLIIADHSAKEGAGTTVGKTLHRIDQNTLETEVLAAGFQLIAAGEFLRHPEDTREEKIFGAKVPIDEFVLKFRKPG
jgi:predicted methyltransferase